MLIKNRHSLLRSDGNGNFFNLTCGPICINREVIRIACILTMACVNDVISGTGACL
jgi:hypothetical protein